MKGSSRVSQVCKKKVLTESKNPCRSESGGGGGTPDRPRHIAAPTDCFYPARPRKKPGELNTTINSLFA